jgi:hypothetical protein
MTDKPDEDPGADDDLDEVIRQIVDLLKDVEPDTARSILCDIAFDMGIRLA